MELDPVTGRLIDRRPTWGFPQVVFNKDKLPVTPKEKQAWSPFRDAVDRAGRARTPHTCGREDSDAEEACLGEGCVEEGCQACLLEKAACATCDLPEEDSGEALATEGGANPWHQAQRPSSLPDQNRPKATGKALIQKFKSMRTSARMARGLQQWYSKHRPEPRDVYGNFTTFVYGTRYLLPPPHLLPSTLKTSSTRPLQDLKTFKLGEASRLVGQDRGYASRPPGWLPAWDRPGNGPVRPLPVGWEPSIVSPPSDLSGEVSIEEAHASAARLLEPSSPPPRKHTMDLPYPRPPHTSCGTGIPVFSDPDQLAPKSPKQSFYDELTPLTNVGHSHARIVTNRDREEGDSPGSKLGRQKSFGKIYVGRSDIRGDRPVIETSDGQLVHVLETKMIKSLTNEASVGQRGKPLESIPRQSPSKYAPPKHPLLQAHNPRDAVLLVNKLDSNEPASALSISATETQNPPYPRSMPPRPVKDPSSLSTPLMHRRLASMENSMKKAPTPAKSPAGFQWGQQMGGARPLKPIAHHQPSFGAASSPETYMRLVTDGVAQVPLAPDQLASWHQSYSNLSSIR